MARFGWLVISVQRRGSMGNQIDIIFEQINRVLVWACAVIVADFVAEARFRPAGPMHIIYTQISVCARVNCRVVRLFFTHQINHPHSPLRWLRVRGLRRRV